jgi:multidrug efflux system membrane fusion protein
MNLEKIQAQDNDMPYYLNRLMIYPILVLTLAGVLWNDQAGAEEIPGQLDWSQRVELGTPVSGIIQMINAEPGQQVKQGEVLLQLDQRGFKAKIDSLTANLKNLRAVRAEAKRELERADVMYERTLLSDHELQVKKNEYIAAQAAYEIGQAQLTLAKLNLEYSTIHAPFDAVVVLRHAEVGQTVISEMQPPELLVVVGMDRMQAIGNINIGQLAKVKLGQKATVKTNGMTFNGKVTAIGLEPESSSNANAPKYPISVTFSTGGKLLRAGQAATIDLK